MTVVASLDEGLQPRRRAGAWGLGGSGAWRLETLYLHVGGAAGIADGERAAMQHIFILIFAKYPT